MDLDLTGRTALITGGSAGIGLASDRARYISGTVETIDGGMSARGASF